MTNENDNNLFSGTQGPAYDPQTQPTDAPGNTESRSIFEKTVFGAAASQPTPTQPQPTPTQPQPTPTQPQPTPTQPTQAKTNAEPPTVHAERVSSYSSPVSGYYHMPAGSPPPYGQTGTNASQTNRGFYNTPVDPIRPDPIRPDPMRAESVPPAKAKKKGSKGLTILFSAIALAAVALVMLSVGIWYGSRNQAPAVQSDPSTQTTGSSVQAGAPELETKASPASDSTAQAGTVLTPTQIAAKVRPWSVGILVYSKTSSGVASEGSGVLWDEDASGKYTYIITCAHVIEGSGLTFSVQTEDGTTYDAEMVGLDAKTDLGVLRIEKTGLELAQFGDSSKLQVGDPVYAIGNPGGTEFFGSFTNGIVSAIDRSVKSTYTMICIQHTAAINPGNSGGALVNQYGQVIGINSQKIMSTEYEGMGFSIPIKSAQPIVQNLAAYGYIKDRPKLGITYAEAVNYQQYGILIKIKGLPSGSLIITEISNDSSLAGTEVKPYDMIIKVDGEELTKPEVLLSKIENGKVGDKITLTICRVDNNYQTKEFTVTATLVEEKKEAEPETKTAQPQISPYDFFNDDFFNGLF